MKSIRNRNRCSELVQKVSSLSGDRVVIGTGLYSRSIESILGPTVGTAFMIWSRVSLLRLWKQVEGELTNCLIRLQLFELVLESHIVFFQNMVFGFLCRADQLIAS